MGKEFHSVADALGGSLGDKDGVAPVVFQCRSNVPAWLAMGCPRGAVVGFFVGYSAEARRSDWRPIEVEVPKDLGVGGELWVER